MSRIPPPYRPPPASHSTIQHRDEPEEKHHSVQCKRCGKRVDSKDIKNGLCPECDWETKTGVIPKVAEKKHHFWSRNR